MYASVNNEPATGRRDESDSDSWNDFSLVESDKERQEPLSSRQSPQNTAMPRSKSNTSGLGTSTHPQASHSRENPGQRYPSASSDLRNEPAGSGRMLPARPEPSVQHQDGDLGARATSTSPTHVTPSTSHETHGSARHHTQAAIAETSRPGDYEPSFHHQDAPQKPSGRALRNLATNADERAGEHERRGSSHRNHRSQHQHQITDAGDPPHDFGRGASRKSRSNTWGPPTVPPGRQFKPGYASGSSLEQVSSNIFDDEDDGQGDLRQSQLRRSNSLGQRTTSSQGRRSGDTTTGPQQAFEPHEGNPGIGDGSVEERALLPIQPGDRNVAWVSRKKGSNAMQLGQLYQSSGSHNSRGGRPSNTTAPMRVLNSSIPELATGGQQYESSQFFFAHVSDGLRAHEPPLQAPYMLGVAKRSEAVFIRMWGELFATLSIPLLLVTTFVAHLLQFVLARAVKRPFMLMQVASDHFLKPLLAVLHNAIIQPLLVFLGNVLSNILQVLAPLSDYSGHFTRLLMDLLQSFRLVEYHHHQHLAANRGAAATAATDDTPSSPLTSARSPQGGGQVQAV